MMKDSIMYSVNWGAIIASVIAFMILGMIWYGPLFGKMWRKAMGINENDKKKMEEMKKGMMKAMVCHIVVALIGSWVFALLLQWLGWSGVEMGMKLGFFTWLGFIVPKHATDVIYENKSMTVTYLGAGYYLAGSLLIGAILGWMM